MKLEINLDETRFKDVVDDELRAFTREEIHDILQKAINQYVMEKGVIERIFYNKKTDYYGKETGELEPTYELKKLVEGLNMDTVLDKLKKDIQDVLEKDETIKMLAENLFYRFITNRIDEIMWRDSTLQGIIATQANAILDSRLQNQH